MYVRSCMYHLLNNVHVYVALFVNSVHVLCLICFQYGVHQMEILTQLKTSIINQPKSFDDCIGWARDQFQEYYHNSIAQLLFNFPADHVSYNKLNTTINTYIVKF